MKKQLDALHKVMEWLLLVTVASLLVPVSLQMLARFTDLIPPYIWTEEMSRFLLIWMIMLGAMIGVRECTHFDVDVWTNLSARANALLRMISMFFVLLFALVFVIWGVEFVRFGWNQTSELADLPMVYIFIAWPLTGLVWMAFLGESFLIHLRIFMYKDRT